MKKCNTELMKELKELEQEKESLLEFERENCKICYLADEEPLDNGYAYERVRTAVAAIDEKARRIKRALALSNATTMVEGFDMTIAEALVYLAQLTQNKYTIRFLASQKAMGRTTVSDNIEYEKALYDIQTAKEDLKKITKEIDLLQMAIDRTNLNHGIEIE